MELKQFIEMIGLENEEIEKNINEVNQDYININGIMEEKQLNYVSFVDDYTKDIKLKNTMFYPGLLNNYVLGIFQ